MAHHTIELTLADPDRTTDFAQTLAPHLGAGDVILLEGGIGAGKTHFCRALIQSCLTTPEDIPSPTFTIVQTYDGAQCEIWHADLYRLGSVSEIYELGLDDAFLDSLCLVEWPDRLGDDAPIGALILSLSLLDNSDARRAVLSYSDPKWTKILKDALDD